MFYVFHAKRNSIHFFISFVYTIGFFATPPYAHMNASLREWFAVTEDDVRRRNRDHLSQGMNDKDALTVLLVRCYPNPTKQKWSLITTLRLMCERPRMQGMGKYHFYRINKQNYVLLSSTSEIQLTLCAWIAHFHQPTIQRILIDRPRTDVRVYLKKLIDLDLKHFYFLYIDLLLAYNVKWFLIEIISFWICFHLKRGWYVGCGGRNKHPRWNCKT